MIKTTAGQLRKGDRIRFQTEGAVYTLARDPQVHSFEHSLLFLTFEGKSLDTVTTPAHTPVYAVSMFRVVGVPCLVHQGDVALRYDMASGGQPRAVLCGNCDDKITAQVMAEMADKRAEDASGAK